MRRSLGSFIKSVSNTRSSRSGNGKWVEITDDALVRDRLETYRTDVALALVGKSIAEFVHRD
jgi:hypothetical protein